MSLFIFCGYYLLHAINKNSFLAELCILVPVHVAAQQYLTDYKNPNSVIENSVCVCVCICVCVCVCVCVHTMYRCVQEEPKPIPAPSSPPSSWPCG